MSGFVKVVSHPFSCFQKCSWLSKSHPSSLASLTHSFILSLIHSLIQVAFPKDLLHQHPTLDGFNLGSKGPYCLVRGVKRKQPKKAHTKIVTICDKH